MTKEKHPRPLVEVLADYLDTDQVTAEQQPEAPVESPFTRIQVFITARSSIRHRLAAKPWPRPLCMERFVIGQQVEALVRDITCERCLAWYDPMTYEVRIPDARYTVGYRVAHTGVATEEEAQALADAINAERPDDAAYVAATEKPEGQE